MGGSSSIESRLLGAHWISSNILTHIWHSGWTCKRPLVWFFWCDWVTSSPGWRCSHDSRGKILQPPLAGNALMTKIRLSSVPNDTTQVYSIPQFTIIFTTLKSLKITRLPPFNFINHFTTSWPWDWRLQSRLSFVHLIQTTYPVWRARNPLVLDGPKFHVFAESLRVVIISSFTWWRT